MQGSSLPIIKTAIPGPRSVELVDELSRTECPAITARRARRTLESGVPQDPIVWHKAKGANVEDVDGNVYVDLTAAFAVAGLGHGHPRVLAAAHAQLDQLVHAMGDVYPSDQKIAFCKRLAELTPADLQQSILGLSGSDAVEAALKTAAIHTGRPGIIAFWGGYHGLSYGALAATSYRNSFRKPFIAQLNPHVRHIPYPDLYRPPFGLAHSATPTEISNACLAHLRAMLSSPATGSEEIGALIIEPIQGRGGEVVPPSGFLAGLRALCDEFGLVLIFDEIFSGFGRTGAMFACDHECVVPDILCVGKGMAGGFPLSAAIGKPQIMASWGLSSGESIHTSTFLGNPLGCAMALAVLDVLVEENWPRRVAILGDVLLARLQKLQSRFPDLIGEVRGRGLMLGIDLVIDPATRAPHPNLAIELMDHCRSRGYLVLPSGIHGNVLAISPPFVITDAQLDGFFTVLEEGLARHP
ncbi:MAG: aspartate aminotransferase family protein [Bradymonadaceae bacterium]|nr:aspartate aminotransferase family protein [Lujinxingiaceae bacterium]